MLDLKVKDKIQGYHCLAQQAYEIRKRKRVYRSRSKSSVEVYFVQTNALTIWNHIKCG